MKRHKEEEELRTVIVTSRRRSCDQLVGKRTTNAFTMHSSVPTLLLFAHLSDFVAFHDLNFWKGTSVILNFQHGS